MGYIIVGGLIILVSCAAYKVGYMQASIMADAKWAKLVEENRQLRAQNINYHMRIALYENPKYRQEYPNE